jgi:hypothetical protein
MQVDAPPDAVKALIDTWRAGGMALQPPTIWPRQRWLQSLPGYADTLNSLPDALDREAVRYACRDATRDGSSATAAFVAVMVWGFGLVGFGSYRTGRALATPGAPERLLSAVRTLADEGPLAAYRRLGRTDDCKLEGLGPAFATKYLYFCQPRPVRTTALILDDLVAFWLDCNVTFRLDAVPWSARTYRRYLDQMHAWADELDCASDDLEQCMFQTEATRRGGQWAVTPADPPR